MLGQSSNLAMQQQQMAQVQHSCSDATQLMQQQQVSSHRVVVLCSLMTLLWSALFGVTKMLSHLLLSTAT
jgi:hypothetical protein